MGVEVQSIPRLAASGVLLMTFIFAAVGLGSGTWYTWKFRSNTGSVFTTNWGLTEISQCAAGGSCTIRNYRDLVDVQGVDTSATRQLMGAGGIVIFLLVLSLLTSLVGMVVNLLTGLGVVSSIPKLPERMKVGMMRAAPWFTVAVLTLEALVLLFWIAIFPYKSVLDSAKNSGLSVTQGAGAGFAVQIVSVLLLIGSLIVDRIPKLQPSVSMPNVGQPGTQATPPALTTAP